MKARNIYIACSSAGFITCPAFLSLAGLLKSFEIAGLMDGYKLLLIFLLPQIVLSFLYFFVISRIFYFLFRENLESNKEYMALRVSGFLQGVVTLPAFLVAYFVFGYFLSGNVFKFGEGIGVKINLALIVFCVYMFGFLLASVLSTTIFFLIKILSNKSGAARN